jgi:hypothetical protein
MLQFTVDDTQPAQVDGCAKCCCETMQLKPGTISKVSVNYASWALPIGRLHCSPQFNLEPMQTCSVPAGADLPPQPADKVAFDVTKNVVFNGDLNTQVTDPEGQPMEFKWLFNGAYGPNRGKLLLRADGTFTYTPDQNYVGPDRFYASASDGINTPVVFEVVLGVGTLAANIAATPHVSVISDGVQVNERLCLISFPLQVSPAAQLCEVWRLSVLQNALDCECTCYQRTDCYDVRIVKC